jgi:hypothetical protein
MAIAGKCQVGDPHHGSRINPLTEARVTEQSNQGCMRQAPYSQLGCSPSRSSRVFKRAPNTSIERTCLGRLRLPRHAAHVER